MPPGPSPQRSWRISSRTPSCSGAARRWRGCSSATGVIVPRRKSGEVLDRAAMAALARNLWLNDPGYLADPRQVAQSADLALEIRYLR